jgi:hypothetical protein
MCVVLGLSQAWWSVTGLILTLIGALVLFAQGIQVLLRGDQASKNLEEVGMGAAFGIPYAPKATKNTAGLCMLTFGVGIIAIGTFSQILGAWPLICR